MVSKKIFSLFVGATMLVSALPCRMMVNAFDEVSGAPEKNVFQTRFEELYADIKDPASGYFSPDGLPYHSVETLMCEAPDQGHESTSESASYYVWLEAMNGKFTGDFEGLEEAWDVLEKYYIPTAEDQPGQKDYNPASPATYAAEYPLPDKYPSELKFGLGVGEDPLFNELKNTYGTPMVYGMHWLVDCDNFYGYGQRGDGTSTPSYINTFQRGPQESTWETIPHPSWEEFKWGGPNGFLDLFTGDKTYSKQWRYTNAPDADARTVQAMFWAKKWADENNVNIDSLVDNASKMGDYLRYSMFDKYFMKIGSQGMTPGRARESQHGLMSWYYSWGGAIPSSGDWAWRIGCSHSHGGYQNPMAAYILSQEEEFIPNSPTAKNDWDYSLGRQLEFYQWLQSKEGGIAGGCTNSLDGSYQTYPAGTSTFYGMAYEENPVYLDPGSNTWFGFQAWSMQRVAEYYYQTGDETVKGLLDRWAAWAASQVKFAEDGSFEIPNKLDWEGQPDTWTGEYTGNQNLSVTVVNWGKDLGVAASLANALTYYSAATKKYTPDENYDTALYTASQILDRMWKLYRDDIGVAAEEERDDYSRFFEQEVYVPNGWTGKMANGDVIKPGIKFIDIRTNYYDDPMMQEVIDAYNEGRDARFTYHRFWAQSEIAIANGTLAILFPDFTLDNSIINVAITDPAEGTEYDCTESVAEISISADASVNNGNITAVEFYANNQLVATDNVAPYTAEFTPDGTGRNVDGTKNYALKAVAVNDKGTKKESEAVNVIAIFNPAAIPEVSITSPAEGSVFDKTAGEDTILVSATSSISSGSVDNIKLYANDELIGQSSNQTCDVVYTIPGEYAPSDDGKVDIIFKAVATSDEGMQATSVPVKVTAILPLKPTVCDLKVSVEGNTSSTTSTLQNSFVIKNEGTDNYDLNALKVRYYFTKDGNEDFIKICDNAGMFLNVEPWYACVTGNVNLDVVNLDTPVANADAYIEVSFNNANYALSSGAKLTIGTRVYNKDWKQFNQTNDYSFGNNENVVLIYNEKVISGKTPK